MSIIGRIPTTPERPMQSHQCYVPRSFTKGMLPLRLSLICRVAGRVQALIGENEERLQNDHHLPAI